MQVDSIRVITSSNDLSAVTFTITGTDIDGNASTENISDQQVQP